MFYSKIKFIVINNDYFQAIERAMRECTEISGQNIKTSVVQFKVSTQGITLTDMSRKLVIILYF